MHSSARLVSMNLMQDAPNVVSEEGLRALLAEGHSADVVCRVTPQTNKCSVVRGLDRALRLA